MNLKGRYRNFLKGKSVLRITAKSLPRPSVSLWTIANLAIGIPISKLRETGNLTRLIPMAIHYMELMFLFIPNIMACGWGGDYTMPEKNCVRILISGL